MSEEQIEQVDVDTPTDPFEDPTALAQLNFITLGRIYDVLFSLLDEQNPDKATFLADLHRAGGFLMSSPRFTAHFVDDEQNGGDQ